MAEKKRPCYGLKGPDMTEMIKDVRPWVEDLPRRYSDMNMVHLTDAFDRFLAFGRHLEEIHVTWAHFEKKRTRLRTNTKTLQDLKSQSLETASPLIYDAVTLHLVTASQHLLTASARTDSTRI
ncbi:hypothetical protein Tco_0798542 [Tanacetum coccineum]